MKSFSILLVLYVLFAPKGVAQDFFKEPEIVKVTNENREDFGLRFESIKWTGAGLYDKAPIDYIPTIELRARLQKVYGDPTQTLKDLIYDDDFRPAEFIQFEYWFVVNDSIPLMILDVDGPFDNGLVYGGASRYVDLMPEIKRTFSKKLMGVKEMGEFQDYFYSPEDDRKEWYNVEYKAGKFVREKIARPSQFPENVDY